MAEEWQVEAVKEQFKVLNSLETLLKDLNINDVREVQNEVIKVVNTHLRVSQNSSSKPIRHICAEIMKATEITDVKFGFIVIVTDQRVNGLLSKIPIFVIQFEDKTVFIDIMSCFVFKSWDMFLKHYGKVLPRGKFCFPVNGRYLDGRRLKVDFHQTITARLNWWQPLLGIAIGIGAFAATYFFKIPPVVIETVKSFIPLAEQFIGSFSTVFTNVLCDLLKSFSQWKTGKMSWLTLAPIIFKGLSKLHDRYEEEIDAMLGHIKDTFWSVWEYLKEKFFLFNRESPQSSPPLRLLATVNSNGESFMRSGFTNDLSQNDMGASRLFENCVRESAFGHHDVKETSQDEPITLTQNNKALVCMTSSFVQQNYPVSDQQRLAQNELSHIYLSLKDLVEYESRERLKLYHKHKDAALKSGSEIDLEEYNKCLGVAGDPKSHCFMEAIAHINQSPMMKFLVKRKCRELVDQEPVQLIQCLKMPNNNKLGLYKSIGMETGLIPAKKFVSPLKKIFCTTRNDTDLFDENKLAVREEVKELSSEIVLFTNRLHIFIWQGLNNENYAEGFLAIFEDN